MAVTPLKFTYLYYFRLCHEAEVICQVPSEEKRKASFQEVKLQKTWNDFTELTEEVQHDPCRGTLQHQQQIRLHGRFQGPWLHESLSPSSSEDQQGLEL